MNSSTTTAVEATNQAAPNELFALTDEQILEIEPQLSATAPVAQPILAVRDVSPADTETAQTGFISHNSRDSAEKSVPLEPPPWLAAQMKDPWTADEARELWNGVLQSRQEAAAYREVFAKPEEARALREDARALKELYPGGVEQARAAAERARTLEEIDAAFYGAEGKTPEQQSAGRAALAQRMFREDPAAFREMVFAGLRALEAAGQSPHPPQSAAVFQSPPNVVPGFSPASEQPVAGAARSRPQAHVEDSLPVGATLGSPAANGGNMSSDGASPAPTSADVRLVAYRAFEKSANDELERSVGGAINRALEQALPVAQPILAVRGDARTGILASSTDQTAQAGLPALQERLVGAIRSDVEAALKGDTQLGEQIAQILSARRFDENTRAQVVRLINDRAQQLVPVAARRVIQDWTQTAFAAHRNKNLSVAPGFSPASTDATAGSVSSSVGAGLAPPGRVEHRATQGSPLRQEPPRRVTASAVSSKSAAADRAEKSVDLSYSAKPRTQGRAVDYRKLSDEQILEL